MRQAPLLSIIFPAFNEATRIGKTLEKSLDYLRKQGYSYELVLVDDGSSDNTIEVAKNICPELIVLVQEKNYGKGAAVRRGMLESKGEIRVFTDSDLSTPIYEIEKMIEKFNNGAEIVIGSRAINRANVKVHQPFYREWMGRIFNALVQIFVFYGVSDTQCGFKGFKADTARKIFSKSKIDGFSFDVEVLFLAKKLGYKIEQISVEWYNDAKSTVSPIKDALNMFIEIFKIRGIHKD